MRPQPRSNTATDCAWPLRGGPSGRRSEPGLTAMPVQAIPLALTASLYPFGLAVLLLLAEAERHKGQGRQEAAA